MLGEKRASLQCPFVKCGRNWVWVCVGHDVSAESFAKCLLIFRLCPAVTTLGAQFLPNFIYFGRCKHWWLYFELPFLDKVNNIFNHFSLANILPFFCWHWVIIIVFFSSDCDLNILPTFCCICGQFMPIFVAFRFCYNLFYCWILLESYHSNFFSHSNVISLLRLYYNRDVFVY